MVLGVISGRLAPDFSRYGPGCRVDTNRQYVVSHIVGFDGDRRRGTGRERERGRGRSIKRTWVPGFRLWGFLFVCKSSTRFVHLIIASTKKECSLSRSRVAPSFYFYSPRVIHPTESLGQSPLNKANMSEWSAPASGTPCWINIPAAEVARGRCQS